MAEYRGFRIPEDLSYDVDYHVWLRVEGDLVVVGATDPAQAYAGDIIHLSIKKPGTRLARGAILATVESAKYMGPMRCPVTGTVAEVNEAVAKQPVQINRDAYGSWVARVRPEKLTEEQGLLVAGAAALDRYRPIIDQWGITSKGA
jgi:glycine cleavage system H protein